MATDAERCTSWLGELSVQEPVLVRLEMNGTSGSFTNGFGLKVSKYGSSLTATFEQPSVKRSRRISTNVGMSMQQLPRRGILVADIAPMREEVGIAKR